MVRSTGVLNMIMGRKALAVAVVGTYASGHVANRRPGIPGLFHREPE